MFVKGLRKLFGKPQPANTVAAEFSAALNGAIQIAGDFAGILGDASPEDGLGPLQSELRLPHPKEKISKSLNFLKAVLNSDEGRTEVIKSLPPEQAQLLLSAKYSESLNSCIACLAHYVPDEQLLQQRKLAEEMLPLIDSLEPKEKEKLLATRNFREVIAAARDRLEK